MLKLEEPETPHFALLAFLARIEQKAGPTGIEPAAYGLRVRRSGLTELRARIKASFEKGSTEKYRACGFVVAS